LSLTQAPYGFRPVARRLGAPVVHFVRRAAIASGYAANVGVGDPVKMLTDGTFALAAAGDAVSAIFAGWQSDDAGVWQTGPNWITGQTWIQPPQFFFWDPDTTYFSVQADGPVPMTSVGDNYDHVAGTPNPRSGHSTAYLGTASLSGAAASAQYKVIDLFKLQNNAWGDAYTEVLVMVNERNLGRVAGNAI
jgi:hypothetical protein